MCKTHPSPITQGAPVSNCVVDPWECNHFVSWRFPWLPDMGYPVKLIPMITFVGHIASMMMVMEMPSPGHFVMPRDFRVLTETGRLH